MADIPSRRSSIIAEKFIVEENTFKRAVTDNPKDKIEIEIGDSKQPDFKPQAKIMRWDNEVNFSLRAEEHPEAVVRTEGKLIKYVTPDYEVHQYEIDPGEIGEDGGLEFEWVLPKKPASNVLNATIQTKELNFFYQPALTQKEIDEGADRPENVVGSYAVYHKTKGGMNRADGMEYKTGKAFHIYRPKVTDKKGEATWAELNIDEQAGVLSVTVPQEFLDNAVYPVVVDPTFGYTSVGATTNNFEDLVASYFDTLEIGSITSMSHYTKCDSGTEPLGMAIYSNSTDKPGTLLAEDSGNATLTTTAGWFSTNISYNFSANTRYWLARWNETNDFTTIYYDAGATDQFSRDTAHDDVFETWPTTWTEAADANIKLSIYATYTTSTSVKDIIGMGFIPFAR